MGFVRSTSSQTTPAVSDNVILVRPVVRAPVADLRHKSLQSEFQKSPIIPQLTLFISKRNSETVIVCSKPYGRSNLPGYIRVNRQCILLVLYESNSNLSTEDSFINRGYTNWKNAITAFRKARTEWLPYSCRNPPSSSACGDIAERMKESLSEERRVNHTMLFTIIWSIKSLAQQGLALRGHSSDGDNFIQLLKMQSETDPAIQAWLMKEQEKYTSGEIQMKFYNWWPTTSFVI